MLGRHVSVRPEGFCTSTLRTAELDTDVDDFVAAELQRRFSTKEFNQIAFSLECK